MNAICNGSDRGREEKLLAREGQKRFAAMELTARAGLKAANLSFWRHFACTVARQTTGFDDKCIHAIALPSRAASAITTVATASAGVTATPGTRTRVSSPASISRRGSIWKPPPAPDWTEKIDHALETRGHNALGEAGLE
jgi:hypothetical protein